MWWLAAKAVARAPARNGTSSASQQMATRATCSASPKKLADLSPGYQKTNVAAGPENF